MKSRRLLIAFYVAPLLAWMALIFIMSTDLGNAKVSQGLIVRFLHGLTPSFYDSLSVWQIHRLNEALRKLCHVTEYMVLTMLAVRAIQFGKPALRLSSFIGAMVLSAGFALSDELHQRFVESRTPSLRDVLIDTAGSTICMLGILAWFYFKGVERRLRERIDSEAEESIEGETLPDARHALL